MDKLAVRDRLSCDLVISRPLCRVGVSTISRCEETGQTAWLLADIFYRLVAILMDRAECGLDHLHVRALLIGIVSS
jgi:hypothetical protein